MKYILKTSNLFKHYGKKTALAGLNMNVKPGILYGFLGVNGAGKTTTISILGKFLRPTSGVFEIHGKLSILPQDARFYAGRKIESQLAYFAALSGIPGSQRNQEVERVLTAVNLLEKKKTNAEKISHGMYKRLGIAQALLGDPDILLLDEPTAGLDPETAFHTRKLIKQLGKEKTVVISSHNLSEISEMCDEIGIIHQGKMQFEGSISDITKKSSSLDIHLSQTIDLNLFNNFIWIKEKKFDDEKRVLNITFDEKEITVEEVNAKMLSILLQEKKGIRQITQGKSLEESFLELVKKET